ncbi:hypothetical protein BDQ12DRAFT_43105 [Crucibulum laeve]|uniref:SUR7/PalI family-domain-containing protein n=1 Tax=Crucibulum laeve TaxID=68775 RepID=A0A5C3MHQ1_9AGAR|nr:hypothetical protein BDQ12DRAFT_43105 [Crucibulum laeve]
MKPQHKPLAGHRVVSGIAFIVLLAAFVLFLLVGLSLPIVKAVYLLSFQATTIRDPPTSIATELRFGVWGVCATSDLNQPTLLGNTGVCYGPQLGYTIPSYITALAPTISDQVVRAAQRSLLVILVLHPIAAALSFLTLVSALFLASHTFAIFTLILAIITSIVGSIVLGIDLALVIVAQGEVSKLQNFDFEVLFGNGIWMIVVAVALTWLAVVVLSARTCYCCGVRKHHYHHHH